MKEKAESVTLQAPGPRKASVEELAKTVGVSSSVIWNLALAFALAHGNIFEAWIKELTAEYIKKLSETFPKLP